MNIITIFLFLPSTHKLSKNIHNNLATYQYYGYDVLKYNISLYLPLNSDFLKGTATIDIKAEQDLDTIKFNLSALSCEGVKVNGNTRNFLYDDSLIKIPYPAITNETLSIEISYNGHPEAGYYFLDSDNEKEITGYTITEPSDSRYWFPCYDHPSDKALLEMHIEVPKNFTVASNGILKGKAWTDSTVIFHWEESYPISTYLISITAAPYIEIDTFYISITGDTIDISYYLYEDDVDAGLNTYKHLFNMLEFFETSFCPYPFKKYGMSEVNNFQAAGMEHQTITTLSNRVIERNWEDVVAHELAHQWWGDMVTLQDWPDIWLNEGFATYSEALFEEHFYGREYFQEIMSARKKSYFNDNIGSIYNPLQLFSWGTVYCKGSWVLHMLRGITKDSIFFDILHTYAERYRYKNATTEDFKNVVEDIYGKDMDWFFDEWIYGKNHPVYDTAITKKQDSIILTIKQIQSQDNIFKMPIEILIQSQDTSILYTIIDSLQTQTFSFYFPYNVEDVIFDPDSILLKEIEHEGVAEIENCSIKYTNYGVKITLNVSENIKIYDVNGRVVKQYNNVKNTVIKNTELKKGVYFIKGDKKSKIKFTIF